MDVKGKLYTRFLEGQTPMQNSNKGNLLLKNSI